MRLKYFLRGLGIGIVVTTIILAISHSANRKMSDSEVIERAKELGMGYTTAAQESSAESIAETSETETEADSSAAETSETESVTSSEPESSEAATTEVETTTQEPTSVRETTTQETTTEVVTTQAETTRTTSDGTETEGSTATTYTLTITSGMSSNTVCDMLRRNGIIADSGDFDRFLVSNGYADRIRVGSFEVNSGMSYEELAAAFCSR